MNIKVAQVLMGHSDIRMTMHVYTDPSLLDKRGAVEQLPAFCQGPEVKQEAPRETGTPGKGPETTQVCRQNAARVSKAASAPSREVRHPHKGKEVRMVGVTGRTLNRTSRVFSHSSCRSLDRLNRIYWL